MMKKMTIVMLVLVMLVMDMNHVSAFSASQFREGNYEVTKTTRVYGKSGSAYYCTDYYLKKGKLVTIKKVVTYRLGIEYGVTYNNTYIEMRHLKRHSDVAATPEFYKPTKNAAIRWIPSSKKKIVARSGYGPMEISKTIYSDRGTRWGIISGLHSSKNMSGAVIYMGNVKAYTPYSYGYGDFRVKNSCSVVTSANLVSNLLGKKVTPRNVYDSNGGVYMSWMKAVPSKYRSSFKFVVNKNMETDLKGFYDQVHGLLDQHPEGILFRVPSVSGIFPYGHTIYLTRRNGELMVLDTHWKRGYQYNNTSSLTPLEKCGTILEWESLEAAIKAISKGGGGYYYYARK